MHIAAYSDATGRGGGEMSLGHLVAALDPALQVTVVGVADEVVGPVAAGRPTAERVVLPVIGGRSDTAAIGRHVAALAGLRPDILHVNLRVPWAATVAVAAGLALPGCRVVAVEQLPIRTEDPVDRWLKTVTSPRLDAHVAVGRGAARKVEADYDLAPGSVRSIVNCVPDVGPVTDMPRSPRRRPVVGAVGRLDPQKAFDVLLEAMVLLPDADLVLIGDGPARPALEAQAHRLGIAGRVTFAGWVDEPRRLLGDLDVFCLPSRSEGFPLSIVEAMLAGLPVVATPVGSVAEAVDDGVTGLLVPKDDAAALAGALARLLGDPALRRSLADTGQARARAEFTVATMARAYEALYAELVPTAEAA